MTLSNLLDSIPPGFAPVLIVRPWMKGSRAALVAGGVVYLSRAMAMLLDRDQGEARRIPLRELVPVEYVVLPRWEIV